MALLNTRLVWKFLICFFVRCIVLVCVVFGTFTVLLYFYLCGFDVM